MALSIYEEGRIGVRDCSRFRWEVEIVEKLTNFLANKRKRPQFRVDISFPLILIILSLFANSSRVKIVLWSKLKIVLNLIRRINKVI